MISSFPPSIHDLPASLEEITQLIGFGPAAALLKAHGGTRLYVPGHPSADHPLSLLLGHDQALALGRRFGGERLEIPLARGLQRLARNRQIRANEEGLTLTKLARKFDLTVSQIKRIRAEGKPTRPATSNVIALPVRLRAA